MDNSQMATTPPRYQDYVIKDGKFIGDFEGMYRNFDDPWHQSREDPHLFRDEALKLEHNNSNWKGMFLCSAFVIEAINPSLN